MRKEMDLDSISSSGSSSTSKKKKGGGVDSPVCLICLKFIRKPGCLTSGSNGKANGAKEAENESELNSVVLDASQKSQSQSEFVDHEDDDENDSNLLQKLLSLSKDYLEVPSESIKDLLVNQSKSKNQIWDSDIFCASCIQTVGSTCQFYNELCFLQLQLHRMLRDLNQTLEESTKSKSIMMGKRLHQKIAKQLKLSGKDCTGRIQEIRKLLATNCKKKIQSQSLLDDDEAKPQTPSPEISNASSSGVEIDATAATLDSENNRSVNNDVDTDTGDTGIPASGGNESALSLASSSVQSEGNKENDLNETRSSDPDTVVRPAKRKRVEVEQENEIVRPKRRCLKALERMWGTGPVETLGRTRAMSSSFSTSSTNNEIYEMEIQDEGQDESKLGWDLRRLRGPIQGIKKPFKCLRCDRGFENIELIKIHEQWCKPASASVSNGNAVKIVTASTSGKALAKASAGIGISSPKATPSKKIPQADSEAETDVKVIEVVGSESATPRKQGRKRKDEPRVMVVYRCKLCDKTYPSFNSLRIHELIHSDSKPFACRKCGVGYAQKNNALKHEAKCTETRKPQRKSPTNSKSSPLKKTRNSVAVVVASYKCRHCGKSFEKYFSKTKHENACRFKKKENKLEKNSEAETGTDDDDTPVKVIRLVGSESATPLKQGKKRKDEPRVVVVYRCKLCPDKIFPGPAALRRHENIHLVNKPFKCRKCGRGHAQKVHALQHEANCTGIKKPQKKIATTSKSSPLKETPRSVASYKCRHCGRRFRMHSMHFNKKQHENACRFKKKETKLETNSEADAETDGNDNHVSAQVIEVVGSESATPLKRGRKKKDEPRVVVVYRCKLCDKTLANVRSLRLHELTHLDSKPFACRKCGVGFTQKYNALKHEAKCRGPQEKLQKNPKTSRSSPLKKSKSVAVTSRKCRYCGKRFKSILSTSNHQNGRNGCKYKPKKKKTMLPKDQSESGNRDQQAKSESDCDASTSSTGQSSIPEVLSQLGLRKVGKGKEARKKIELNDHEQEQQTADETGDAENQQEHESSKSDENENESWLDADTSDDGDLDLTTTMTIDINAEVSLGGGDIEQADKDNETGTYSFPNSSTMTSSSGISAVEVVEDSHTDSSQVISPDVLEVLGEGQRQQCFDRSSDRDSDLNDLDNEKEELEKMQAGKNIVVKEEDKDDDSMELLDI